MRRAVACALVLAGALSGCSLVWHVDPDEYRDAGIDAPSEDAGEDAGDAGDAGDDGGVDSGIDGGGGCVPSARFERVCGGEGAGEDEDCDGLVDCNDFDCATTLDCCAERGPLFPTESFTSFPADWVWMPVSEGPIDQGSAGNLNDFGNAGHPRAVRVDECIPIDLGVRITAQMTATNGPAVCFDGSSDCENYASIAITESTDLIPPAGLSSHLTVRLDRQGHAQVRAATGDLVLDSSDDGVTFGAAPISVRIELTPGVDEDGQPSVFATVVMTQGSTTWPRPPGAGVPAERTFVQRPAIPRAYLLGETYGCVDARGLLLAFEGYGPNNTIDNVGVTRFGCANPSHFEPVRAIGTEIDADDLDGTLAGTDSDDWTMGGLGSPAIQSFFPPSSGSPRTELFYDASNRERTLEGRDDVHYSIGGSYTSALDGITSFVPRVSGAPLLGLRPPDCLGTAMPPEGCDMLRSFREPGLYVPVDDVTRERTTTFFPLVFARETGSSSGVFEIAGATASASDMPATTPTSIAIPDVECVSMRDPVIVPTRPDEQTDLVVLYTCERLGRPSSIRALTLDEFPPTTVTRLPGEVINPAALGPIAVGGVRAADAAVWFRGTAPDQEIVVRVWFVSQDLSRDPATLSFAEGTGPIGALPVLHPYAANPVLRSHDPLLGACPTAGCQIESVAVTRLADTPNTVRLLISRTPEDTTGIRHVLVPIDQVWPALD